MVAKVGLGRRAGRGAAANRAAPSGDGETPLDGDARRGIPSIVRLVILGTLGLVAHSRGAVAQNAASVQIAAVVMELPAARVLPAYLEREVRRAGQQTLDSGWGLRMRRAELGGGLAAVMTEGAGRRLRVCLEYIGN
jgi:hypothetical protein